MKCNHSFKTALLLIFSTIALSSIGQEDNRYKKFKDRKTADTTLEKSTSNKNYMQSSSSQSKIVNYQKTDFLDEAGEELIVASNHFYTGFGLTFAGAGISTIGFILKDKEDYESYLSTSLIIGGSAMSLVGIIFTIESVYHIKRAGMYIRNTDNYNLSVQTTNNGVGLVLNL